MTPQRTPARPASHTVIPASPDDTGTLAQLIADAFFPLAPCRWLVPDGTERRQILPPYFQMYVEHALAGGLVHTTPDRTAVALWLPAGAEPETPPDGYARRLADITGRHAGRFLVLDAEFDHHHPAGTPHHHLAILAVRPDRQGRGTGTALLAAHHAALDAEGTPAYLEAADQRNRRLYLTCGYTDHGEPIQLPDGPVMHPMWRQPQPRQPAR